MSLMVTITDRGVELDTKFDKGYQISTLKRIVKAMGGKLEAKSDAEITTYSVRIPCFEVTKI